MESKKFRITYNAPVVLSFCLFSTAVFIINRFTGNALINTFFTVSGHGDGPAYFNFSNPLDYFGLIFHVIGHQSESHLFGNMCYLLLLGPILEQRYGSLKLGIMMIITSLVSGFVNALFLPYAMNGSSDIVFMMILLISYTSFNKKEIPVSFILIFILFIGTELFSIPNNIKQNVAENAPVVNNQIATFAHIAGGICGSLFAFIFTAQDEDKGSISDISDFEDDSKPKGKKKTVKKAKPKKAEKKQEDDDSTVVGSIDF